MIFLVSVPTCFCLCLPDCLLIWIPLPYGLLTCVLNLDCNKTREILETVCRLLCGSIILCVCLIVRSGHIMDPADPDVLGRLLQSQEERLQRQEESLSVLRHEWRAMSEQQGTLLSAFGSRMNFLIDQVQQLQRPVSSGDAGADSVSQTSAAAPSSPLSGSSPHLQLSRPERFSGDSGDCRSFLTQCELHFEFQASSFTSDRAKIAFIISHLSGRALDWATAEWNRRTETCNSLRLFTKTFSQIFQTVSPGREAARKLVALHQNRRRVMDYAIEFRTLAAESGWNEAALSDAFLHGLSESIKDHLAPLDLPAGLDPLIALAVKIDDRLHERERAKPRGFNRAPQPDPVPRTWVPPLPSSVPPTPSVPAAEPMQLGRTRLSPEERQRRMREGRCIYCAQLGHFLSACPVRSTQRLVSKTTINYDSVRRLTDVSLTSKSLSLRHQALIDSGADASFMDVQLAQKLNLTSVPLPEPINASALDGRLLCIVTHVTSPVTLSFSDSHTEELSFHLYQSSLHPLILGHPWLIKHDPHIDWSSGRVRAWGPGCKGRCFPSLNSETSLAPSCGPVQLSCEGSGSSPKEDFPDLSNVPTCYLDLKEVFNKAKATSLPPHRPYDCAIDLLPGSSPPKGRLFSLSGPETLAMKDYIDAALASGIIRPSSSPAGAGFFFVGKKDKTLRPCIDYRGLNEITIKNRYPLPLISTGFELLKGAKIFTKLDLRNAYHLVRIREGDEWKTAFNTPSGHYEYLVMPFGLTNAPAVFQALVNDVLRDMLNLFVFVYLDDILIFSPDETTHRHHVKQVLRRLLDNQLFVKAEKCEFHVPTVSFLGFIVSEGEVRMDPDKVSAVTSWPTPSCRKEVQRFLGFANFYRKFIRNFSSVAAPLHALTSPQSHFDWTPQAEKAFQRLKQSFSTAPVLTLPDPSLQFVVEVDASDLGIGAVLSQRSVTDKRLHPCAFLSKKLSPAERNYGVGDRELLAIKVALEEWRHWLEGAEQPFLVWTDHKNLEYLKAAKRLNARQA